MTTLALIRHAENDFVRAGKLAGWTPEVHLNDHGKRQAQALGARLANAHFTAIYSSPLERATETADAISANQAGLTIIFEERLGEVRYGDWTGQRLRQLARTRLWKTIQHNPSQARFPNGESIREMQVRAIAAIEEIVAMHSHGLVAAISHGDVIKALVAHYAGMHLDQFQRIVISPASISMIGIHRAGATIIRLNDTYHCDHMTDEQEK